MLHLGCVTYNILKDWDLETIIRNLEDAGYEAVELRTGHKHGVEPSLTERSAQADRGAVSEDQSAAAELRLDLRVRVAGRGSAAPAGRDGQAVGGTGARYGSVGSEGAAQRAAAGVPDGDHDRRISPRACASWAITGSATASRSGWRCTAPPRRTRRFPRPS